MQLFVTWTSPYARLARIVVIEKGLEDRVEVMAARTRAADSPYYAINLSGRVPYLLRDDGSGLEDSSLICAYLDALDGAPGLPSAIGGQNWEAWRVEAQARSMLDGLSVWGRELYRPPDERSPTIIEHERQRAARFADLWEAQIAHPLLKGALNMAQLTLLCALQASRRNPDFKWQDGRPALAAWEAAIARRPSIIATAPPE